MSKIKVEEILKRHEVITSAGDSSGGVWKSDVMAAIKEIVEAVLDKAAEEVTLKGRTYNAKTKEIKDITDEIGGDSYWDGHPEDQPYPDLSIEVDKQSILDIKKEVDYE